MSFSQSAGWRIRVEACYYMATLLTIALLLVILVLGSKPACGYSLILFVIVWAGESQAERFECSSI